MGRVLLSTVLVVVALLAACAAGGPRDQGAEGLEAPRSVSAGRSSVSGAGFGAGSISSSAASVTFETDGPQDERPSTQRAVLPDEGLLFDAGVLYAMAYIPSSSGVETERANSLAELYADARPGYGLYTFVLGGPVGPQSGADALAYDELLRVIDTYVLDSGDEFDAGSGRHGFLIQVDPVDLTDLDPPGGTLAERARPGLSLQMQVALARQLRMFGYLELADRLEHSYGPFLVTSLRPALIPMSGQAPLLIVDLQHLGPEYMYSLIDAYDRPIPGDLLGRQESLSAIGRRVQGIFPNRRLDGGAEPPPSGIWIWLIGEPGQTVASAPTSL